MRKNAIDKKRYHDEHRYERQIAARSVVVDQILVAEREAIEPLAETNPPLGRRRGPIGG